MSHELPTALSLCETAWAQGGYLAAKLAALACVAQRRGTVTMWDDTGQIIVRGHPSEALQTVFYWPDGRRVAIPVPVRPRPQQG